MSSEKWLDLAILIVALVFGITMAGICLRVYSKPIATNRVDKSTVQSSETITVDADIKTGKDLLMSLVVADGLMPYPRAIRINDTPVIRMTDDWVVNKSREIARLYSASGSVKLATMLEWKVASVSYVDDAEGGYLQYVLTQ